VDNIGSPTFFLAKYLADTLKPLFGNTPTYVKNLHHLVDNLQQVNISPNDFLASFDVKSLFTNVPVNEAIDIIDARHGINPTTKALLKF